MVFVKRRFREINDTDYIGNRGVGPKATGKHLLTPCGGNNNAPHIDKT
jgi:hypothetical protein